MTRERLPGNQAGMTESAPDGLNDCLFGGLLQTNPLIHHPLFEGGFPNLDKPAPH